SGAGGVPRTQPAGFGIVNPFDIAGKTILVTGGTRGLGRAIALHLAGSGATVIAGYAQNEAAAAEYRELCQRHGYAAHAVRANLMTAGGIQHLAAAVKDNHGRLDALVYNAATGVHKPLEALSQRHLAAVWQVNAGAFVDLCNALR